MKCHELFSCGVVRKVVNKEAQTNYCRPHQDIRTYQSLTNICKTEVNIPGYQGRYVYDNERQSVL